VLANGGLAVRHAKFAPRQCSLASTDILLANSWLDAGDKFLTSVEKRRCLNARKEILRKTLHVVDSRSTSLDRDDREFLVGLIAIRSNLESPTCVGFLTRRMW
jgi:hypothetical protein